MIAQGGPALWKVSENQRKEAWPCQDLSGDQGKTSRVHLPQGSETIQGKQLSLSGTSWTKAAHDGRNLLVTYCAPEAYPAETRGCPSCGSFSQQDRAGLRLGHSEEPHNSTCHLIT